jgi:hypothetical protein
LFSLKRLEKFYPIESNYDFFAPLRGHAGIKKSPIIQRLEVKGYNFILISRQRAHAPSCRPVDIIYDPERTFGSQSAITTPDI